MDMFLYESVSCVCVNICCIVHMFEWPQGGNISCELTESCNVQGNILIDIHNYF